MTEQAIFDFLKKNLTVNVDADSYGRNYETPGGITVNVSLWLTNPATGKPEAIGNGSGSLQDD